MAFGGTHKLVLGLHNRGYFNEVQELTILEVISYTPRMYVEMIPCHDLFVICDDPGGISI